MSPVDTPAIPKGSTVLVTGASGWVGSNVADQFLAYGYKVRGTTRDVNKASWLSAVFEKRYGKGAFELIGIPDMIADGAYDDAVKGVSAVAHTASIMSFDTDPNKVIPGAISGAINALKAAYLEPGVKRFVLTSSSSAAALSGRNLPKVVVKHDTWNDSAVKIAWSEEPHDELRAGQVYAASKTQAEQEVWRFHKENRAKRPDLVVNTVLPNMVFGRTLDLEKQGYPSSSGFLARLYTDGAEPPAILEAPRKVTFILKTFPKAKQCTEYFIGASDTGALHVAGAILPEVTDERIFGFAGRFSWDAILDVFRKLEPEKKFAENFSGGEDPNEIEPAPRAEQLLRDLGRPGWASLEEVVNDNVRDLRTAATT
ncbi:hypothetical protein AK830_g11462 [Neonectria ditissima]|uniref:NAD-dependent epimerase/dehydratase domain-containing protein n=1 Tax=Neonectria ditissima TaxID=78410 RepID=A0A0P7B2Y9_9HYPO|nr:hypothetical protein AK830_g11462 [Neonectria ditissima]